MYALEEIELAQDEVEAMQLRFISDVAALDGYGAAASMEAREKPSR